ILPGIAHAQAGPAVIFSYFFAGLLAMTGMLSQAELVSAMPKAGGTYFYVTRTMGPAIGTVDGLLTWFSLCLKSAFALGGMAAFMVLIVDVDIHIVAIGLCFFFVVLNIIGVKEAAKAQVALVLALLALLVLYVFLGLPKVDLQHFKSFLPYGYHSVFVTAGLVFVSFGGLLKVASVAEEVKNPGKVIPLAMILSLLVVSILYMLVIFVTSGVLGADVLDKSITPITDGAFAFMGNGGRIALSIAAILAFVSTANAGIMAASRYPLALSRDGLLPASLMEVNDKYKTPHIALIVTGLFMIVALCLDLTALAKAASSALLLTYIFSCLCLIIMRESHLQNYQPSFKAPLYPWIQIIGIFGFGFLLFEMGKEALLISSILMACGFFIYWFYGRIRSTREFALLHLIERITAKELTTRSLETELKEIIHERDDVIKDKFDHIIEQSEILDIENSITVDELFRIASQSISKSITLSEEEIFEKLNERENESTTVISPKLAVPHIIIDGEHIFTILLIRCKEGIVFFEDAPKVQTVFLLMGTKDERNLHLRVLSAIAQIIQDPNFEKKWIQAKSKEDLRDLILLGKRRRL
ncbi:amino acid permease, partial [bacterium]|nr:amino acid permease [bacterium]